MSTFDLGFNKSLENQLKFIQEIDKVKSIFRQSKIFDGSRFENDAEHSWTIAVMAVLLQDHLAIKVDLSKVLIMLLIHDIVEIDAGDTFLYSEARKDAPAKELEAAKRIFGLLEEPQKSYFLNLWMEFEARQSPEAKYAAVFDRLEPLLQNYINEGYTWKKHKIRYEQVYEKNKAIAEMAPDIWNFVLHILSLALEKGYLLP